MSVRLSLAMTSVFMLSSVMWACRDATGLPPPPPGRTNQDGGRGRPPKGPGDRQNRWAQDGPLDDVPPGQDQWGKPGDGVLPLA